MEQIRSFIAIELPEEIRLKLGQVESRLKSGSPSGIRWVKPENIHLTLKFLGNVAADRTAEITDSIETAAQKMAPFRLEIRGGGAFPDLTRLQVVWIGIKGEVAKLGQLQQSIETNLERLGFAAETRRFTAHLTLARLDRKVSPSERRSFGQLIAGAEFEAGNLEVDGVSLMRSQLTGQGAVYSRLSFIKLN